MLKVTRTGLKLGTLGLGMVHTAVLSSLNIPTTPSNRVASLNLLRTPFLSIAAAN